MVCLFLTSAMSRACPLMLTLTIHCFYLSSGVYQCAPRFLMPRPLSKTHTHAHAYLLIWSYAFTYHLSRTYSHPSILLLTS